MSRSPDFSAALFQAIFKSGLESCKYLGWFLAIGNKRKKIVLSAPPRTSWASLLAKVLWGLLCDKGFCRDSFSNQTISGEGSRVAPCPRPRHCLPTLGWAVCGYHSVPGQQGEGSCMFCALEENLSVTGHPCLPPLKKRLTLTHDVWLQWWWNWTSREYFSTLHCRTAMRYSTPA